MRKIHKAVTKSDKKRQKRENREIPILEWKSLQIVHSKPKSSRGSKTVKQKKTLKLEAKTKMLTGKQKHTNNATKTPTPKN